MDNLRVLIVEDDKTGWAEPMQAQLQNLHQEITCEIAEDVQTAINYLTRARFHFVSFDQNLPECKGDRIATQFGIDLVKRVKELNPLISGCIYSAYGKQDDNILIHAKRYQFDYLDKAKTSAQQWAHYVSDYLQNQYWSSYFAAGTQVLPPPLAEAAAFLARAEQKQQFSQWVDYYLNFWEITLCLTWAQALGLARHFRIPERLSGHWQYDQIVRRLHNLIPELARAGRIRCWNSYLGAQGSGKGWLALTCLDDLRRLRNELVHAHVPGQHAEIKETLLQHALPLTDLAAFWADFPLIRFNEAHQAEHVSSNRYPLPQANLTWQPPQGATSEHIYVTWREPDDPADKHQLVSLWPYLKLRRDSTLNRAVLYVVSHVYQEQGRTTWYEVNLQNGQQQTFPPGKEEARILSGR